MLFLSMSAKIVMGEEMSADNNQASAILYTTALLDTIKVCLACNGFLIPMYRPTDMNTMWYMDEEQQRTSNVTQKLHVV